MLSINAEMGWSSHINIAAIDNNNIFQMYIVLPLYNMSISLYLSYYTIITGKKDRIIRRS